MSIHSYNTPLFELNQYKYQSNMCCIVNRVFAIYLFDHFSCSFFFLFLLLFLLDLKVSYMRQFHFSQCLQKLCCDTQTFSPNCCFVRSCNGHKGETQTFLKHLKQTQYLGITWDQTLPSHGVSGS